MDAAAFFLMMYSRAAVAELMAECPICGAITTQVLEVAWRARMATCPECLATIPITGDVLRTLRTQALEAQASIDRLPGV